MKIVENYIKQETVSDEEKWMGTIHGDESLYHGEVSKIIFDAFEYLKSQIKEREFTTEDMEKCFEAGCKFGRNMFINPSNSEYIDNLKP